VFGRKYLLVVLVGFLAAGSVSRADAAGSFSLSVPQDLEDSGFLKYLLPRFSLKTGTRIELVGPDSTAEARISDSSPGMPVFEGLGKIWALEIIDPSAPGAARFKDWLTGEVGRRTINSFPAGEGLSFVSVAAQPQDQGTETIAGDTAKGERLAILHCGRCHRINPDTRMLGIGSSPSFAVMRSFSDWKARFEGFFALNPHPSFTIIEDVTEAFDETRPPSIVPVTMSLSDLDAIMAFVSRIPPADLGAPLQYQ